MRILIAGIDGYLGWPLALHLASRGHTVGGIDAFFRRNWVKQIGGQSALPILDFNNRKEKLKQIYQNDLWFKEGSLSDFDFLNSAIKEFKPDSIVHLAEMSSAPYSMASRENALFTQLNNITGTINLIYAIKESAANCHLVKLGTMGEYGTPNVNIPEGTFEIEYQGRRDIMPFPKQAGSWYHLSKVHDSNNLIFASKLWNLSITDIMQGVVYGTRTNEIITENLFTRFDYDHCFGTAINRFCAQAVLEQAITPYGHGTQKRSFIPLRDSIQCLRIAIENPCSQGEYRVLNQFHEVYSINELAEKVCLKANYFGLKTKVSNLANPRFETEDHFYNPECSKLIALGYQPSTNLENEISLILNDLIKYKERLNTNCIAPKILWKNAYKN